MGGLRHRPGIGFRFDQHNVTLQGIDKRAGESAKQRRNTVSPRQRAQHQNVAAELRGESGQCDLGYSAQHMLMLTADSVFMNQPGQGFRPLRMRGGIVLTGIAKHDVELRTTAQSQIARRPHDRTRQVPPLRVWIHQQLPQNAPLRSSGGFA